MREIKFRGKTANGDWVYGSLAYSDNIEPAIYFEFGKGTVKTFDFVYVIPETVGQFTGIHDSTTWKELTEQERKDWTMKGHMPSEWRGRKVYEGDILEWLGIRLPITWNDFHPKFMFGKDDLVQAYVKEGKLIGNIHDNPELLEVGE